MSAFTEGPPDPDAPAGPFWKRLAWFGGLAGFAAFTTALAGYGLTSSLGL